MYLIRVDPFTRVNDRFVRQGKVNCDPVTHDVTHPLVTAAANTDHTRLRADFYKHVALDVVTETVFDYPYPAITSKTLRPIICKRMFVVFGPKGVLALLQSKGFRTWDDYIDESYDDISNPEDRFLAAAESVRKFCSRDLSSIVAWMSNNQDRFEHNFAVLKSLRQQETQQLRQRLAEEF